MNRRNGIFLLSCLLAPALAVAQPPPLAPERPVTDIYFGRTVVDPYRWLENAKAPETKAWLDAQASHARTTLDSLPGRAGFAERARYFADAAPYGTALIRQAGGQLFYARRARGTSHLTVMVRPLKGGADRTLIDLAALSKPGHEVTLIDYRVSENGKVLAAVLQSGGDEMGTARFYDVASGKPLADTLHNLASDSFDLSADGRMFFYVQREALPPARAQAERFRRLAAMVHTMGTPEKTDRHLAGRGATSLIVVPEFASPVMKPAGHAEWAMAFVFPGESLFADIWIRPANGNAAWRKLATTGDEVADAYARNDAIYLVSFRDAPNGKVLRVDGPTPDLSHAKVAVPESTDVLTTGTILGTDVLLPASDALYIRAARVGRGKLLRLPYDAGATASTVALPAGLQVLDGKTNPGEPGAMLRLQSWTDPGDSYGYDPATGVLTAMGLKAPNDIDLTDLVAEEVMVKGKDGTEIPLSIVYRKGLQRDGQAPVLLTGYGAYGEVEYPYYDRMMNAWFERGGIYADAHVRGGGEYGERWHAAGQKATKHNTWEDFVACGDYLVEQGYTSRDRLGAWSASAGGILIGRALTSRPDAFAAVVDGVPMSDTMRYETDGNGPTNVAEFGTVKTPEGADALFRMSAYHHVEKGVAYPGVLVTAGANDPRVPVWQGAKMAAMLQASTRGGPVLLRVNQNAGHFADTIAQRISDFSDIAAFLLWQFGDPAFQPPATESVVEK